MEGMHLRWRLLRRALFLWLCNMPFDLLRLHCLLLAVEIAAFFFQALLIRRLRLLQSRVGVADLLLQLELSLLMLCSFSLDDALCCDAGIIFGLVFQVIRVGDLGL